MSLATALMSLAAALLILQPLLAPSAVAAPTSQGISASLNQQTFSKPPSLTAQAASLMNANTGKVLYNYNGDVRRPMASTTKMVTALVTLKYARTNEVATVYPRDLVGGSTSYLVSGERMTIGQLLYCALLPSGNDAAYTLADYIGRRYLGGVGSNGITAFVNEMNTYVQQMGLRNTHFETPNGFDTANQFSTANDLAVIGRRLLHEPTLAKVVNTSRYTAIGYVGGKPRHHYLRNTNHLLNEYKGANGIKTGTTGGAGEVLVASANRNKVDLIAVVMGSQDRFSDDTALLNWGFSSLQLQPKISVSQLEQFAEKAANIVITTASSIHFGEVRGRNLLPLSVPKLARAP